MHQSNPRIDNSQLIMLIKNFFIIVEALQRSPSLRLSHLQDFLLFDNMPILIAREINCWNCSKYVYGTYVVIGIALLNS